MKRRLGLYWFQKIHHGLFRAPAGCLTFFKYKTRKDNVRHDSHLCERSMDPKFSLHFQIVTNAAGDGVAIRAREDGPPGKAPPDIENVLANIDAYNKVLFFYATPEVLAWSKTAVLSRADLLPTPRLDDVPTQTPELYDSCAREFRHVVVSTNKNHRIQPFRSIYEWLAGRFPNHADLRGFTSAFHHLYGLEGEPGHKEQQRWRPLVSQPPKRRKVKHVMV